MFKKFISILAALAMFVGAATAQTIEHPKFFENTYVTVMGGVSTVNASENSFFWDNIHNPKDWYRPAASLEIGKYFTPVVGFSVEGVALKNTIETNTWVNQSNVIANAKFNLSNLFGGYKGQPRRVEFVLVPGLGWGHDYGYYGVNEAGEKIYSSDPNYATYNAALEMNINLGKQRAWQINIKPVYTINHRDVKDVFVKENMHGRLMAGVTYKFGSRSKKSHNFVLCPYSVTKADYDAVVAERDALKNQAPVVKEVIKETVVIKEVPVEKTRNVVAPMNVTFAMGSAQLSDVEKAKIEEFVESTDVEEVLVVGSADKGTGTLKRNEYLAKERANVVAKFLEKLGIKAKVDTALDVNENSAEASRAAIIEANAQ